MVYPWKVLRWILGFACAAALLVGVGWGWMLFSAWQKAQTALTQGETRQAAAALAALAEKLPGRGDLWQQAGQLALEAGDLDAADAYLRQALSNGGAAQEIYPALLFIQRTRRDYPAAVQTVQAMLALDPGQPEIAYQLGLLLAATQPSAAPPYLATDSPLRKAIDAALDPDEPAYTFLAAGQALAQSGQWDLAQTAFERAVALRPDYAEA